VTNKCSKDFAASEGLMINHPISAGATDEFELLARFYW
jgi:hypothetical protein